MLSKRRVFRYNTSAVPNTDTLKLILKEFGVSAGILLCAPPMHCQSCGMTLYSEDVKGTKHDGSKSEEYCTHCYGNGAFLRPMTLDVAAKEKWVHPKVK